MLKWFRLYNKYLLVFFGSLLMVVFLIEGAISGILPQREDQVVGRVQGEKIRYRDQTQAGMDIQIISQIMPPLMLLAPQDEMQWLLMVHGAKQAGISASNTQVAQLLSRVMPESAGSVAELARGMGINAEQLTNALRHWLMIQDYMELASGLGHLTMDQRLQALQQGMQYLQMGIDNPQIVVDPARGQARISRPLLERFLQDQQATATVQAVAIRPERELPNVSTPDDQTVQALYDEYKDELPGGDEGYGLGYKLPDRVKIEYLTFSLANARKAVDVEESQLLAHYDQNPDRYRPAPAPQTDPAAPPAPPAAPRPYLEVRDQILAEMTDQAAYRLAERASRAAQAMLSDDARELPEKAGYREVTDTWTPQRLTDLAKELQDRFGMEVEVRQIKDQWLTLNEVAALPGLGSSFIVMGQRTMPTTQYITSARELKPQRDHLAASLHLQVYLPSLPVQSQDGSFHLFRLTDAQATHTPALADIRQQVVQDAQRIEAYKRLVAQIDTFKAKLDQPLASLAQEFNTTILGPASFNRRNTFGGVTEVPQVPGVGRSASFVDQVFDLAIHATDADSAQASQADTASPLTQGVIAADDKLTVYLVNVLEFQPMTRREFEQQLSMPFNQLWINMAMTSGLQDDPFSVENLAKKVGFVWEQPPRDENGQDNTPQG